MPFRQLALRASRRPRDPQMQATQDLRLFASVDHVTVWRRPALPGGHHAAFLSGLSVSAFSARDRLLRALWSTAILRSYT
jgi:hypothetical protein